MGRVACSTDGVFLTGLDLNGTSLPVSKQKVIDLLRLSVHALAERVSLKPKTMSRT